MGMGWNILRRKQVALLCFLLAAPALAGGQEAHVKPGEGGSLADFRRWARVPFSPPALGAGEAARPETDVLTLGEVVVFTGSSLPPIQGHVGEEMYTLSAPDRRIVDGFVRSYLAKKAYLQSVLSRIPTYRIPISEAISRLELPPELLYLPALESGFQPRAVSSAGAAGLWQLMTNTASPSGLKNDDWLDERKDFLKATEASLKKLKYDRSVFGDWFMALAAYNCGAARLSSIVKESGTRDYWTLRKKGLLPRETASFVPAFLALSRICGYPGRHGLSPSWSESVEWAKIEVEVSVDLEILCRLSGAPLELMKAGNAELKLSMTPPASYKYSLKVPVKYFDDVCAVLENPSGPLREVSIHVVKAGDTLGGIARAYGVPLEWIVEQNPTVKPQALQLGCRILVPRRPTAGKTSALDGSTQWRRG
jgi:membrane-bound lytic murein transglycosylase D